MPQRYECSTCHQKVEGDLMKYIDHTKLHIIDEIKKKYPDWDCTEGLCPTCLEYFENAMHDFLLSFSAWKIRRNDHVRENSRIILEAQLG